MTESDSDDEWYESTAKIVPGTATVDLGAYNDAYEQGYRDGQASRRSTYAILTDLLRDGTWEADCYCCENGCPKRDMADRTEARLREVGDQPEATPEWYRKMVGAFEQERQAHLNTKAILQDLIAELRVPDHVATPTRDDLHYLADRVAASDYAVAWVREIERTAEVRGILTDLIDHLREWEKWQRDHPMDNPDYLGWLADRAEARLREVTGE